MTTIQELEYMTPSFCLNVLRNGTMSHLLELIDDTIKSPSIVKLESYRNYVRILRSMHVSSKKGIWDQAVSARLEDAVDAPFHTYFDVVEASYDTLEGVGEEVVDLHVLHEYRIMIEDTFKNLVNALTTLTQPGGD